jgi:RNA polymerase sigma-70 factor (ECF subfamily)
MAARGTDSLTMKQLSALMDVLKQNESSLLGFISARLGCPDTAADLLQQLAEKLLRQKNPGDIQDHKAYLYQSARNEIVNHYRSEQSRQRHESSFIAQHPEDEDGITIEQAAIASRKLQRLDQSLQQLPLLTREIFWQYRIEGQRQKDIAGQMNISLSTVEKHLASAMKHLRQSLLSDNER